MPQMPAVLSMQAGTGYQLSLKVGNAGAQQVRVAMRSGECYVQPVYASTLPGAPTASPAPAPGAASSWAHLKVSGETRQYLYDQIGGGLIYAVLVWCVGAGELELSPQ